jgi:hypothetical protein
MRMLLAAGAKVNAKASSDRVYALRTAIVADNIYGVNALLAAGADVNCRHESGITPGERAIYHNRIDIFKKLIAVGMPVDGLFFGIISSREGEVSKTEFIASVLMAGADIEERCPEETPSPLQISLVWRELDIAIMLLDKGANFNAGTDENQSVIKSIEASNDISLRRLVRERQEEYKQFITSRTAPVNAKKIYHLLSAVPLANPYEPVDYAGNLQRIFTHAKWKNKEQAQGVLAQIQEDGMITAETVEAILAATFPPLHKHSMLQTQPTRGR